MKKMRKIIEVMVVLCLFVGTFLVSSITYAEETKQGGTHEREENPVKDDVESTKENEKGEEIDYYYGRKLTQEEIDGQNAMVPELKPLPEFGTMVKKSEKAPRMNFPSSYDARNYGLVTSVKNQNPYGTCWSMSAVSALESAMVKGNLAINSMDLSERALAYFTYNNVVDPLGLTAGDATYMTPGVHWASGGGSSEMASLTLNRGIGPIHEGLAPYNTAPVDESLAFENNIVNVKKEVYVNTTDHFKIKSSLLTYGAGTVSYYHVNSYMNNSTGAYYIGNHHNWWSNHEVSIVGWDDNYSRYNFNSLARPANNGAFLIKNSFGSGYGAGGYNWISYEDAAFSSKNKLPMLFFEVELTGAYDNTYQYDGTSLPASCYVNVNNSLLNQFTVNNEYEVLDEVSIMSYTPDVFYKMQIYVNPENLSDPTSGEKQLVSEQVVHVPDAGFQRIKLNKNLLKNKNWILKQGDEFVIEFIPDRPINAAVSANQRGLGDYQGYSSVNTTLKNQSYIKTEFSINDLHGQSINLRIKGYTKNQRAIISKTEVVANVGNQIKLEVKYFSQNTELSKNTIWSSTNSEIATVDMNGNITVVKDGFAQIKAESDDGMVSKCNVYSPSKNIYLPVIKDVKVNDVDSTGYTINFKTESEIGIEKILYPTWTEKNGQDDIIWQNAEFLDSNIQIRVNTENHNYEAGSYITHLYVYDKFGNPIVYVISEVVVPKQKPVSITEVVVSDVSSGGYTINAKVQNAVKVQFPTWTEKNGQDDITWGEGNIIGDQVSYRVEVTDHRYEEGIYNTHIYAYSGDGEYMPYVVEKQNVANNNPTISDVLISDVNSGGYTVNATIEDDLKISRVLIPTWTEKNGQDDITWDEVTVINNKINYRVNVSEHKNEEGMYFTHIYAYDDFGKLAVHKLEQEIKNLPPIIKDVKVSEINGGGYTVNATIEDDSKISKVLMPTWTEKNGQDDITWEKIVVINGKIEYRVEVSSHNNEEEVYNTHIYAYDDAGKITVHNLTQNIVNFKPVIKNVEITNISADGYTISAEVTDDSKVTKVLFPTWTDKNGQDDITWGEASVKGDKVSYRVNTKSHKNEEGIYNTHIYVYDNGGKSEVYNLKQLISNKSPIISDVRITEISNYGYTITAKITDDGKLEKVLFPTWTAKNGQDDITWERGEINENSVRYRVSKVAHKNEIGIYYTHIYAYDCGGKYDVFTIQQEIE